VTVLTRLFERRPREAPPAHAAAPGRHPITWKIAAVLLGYPDDALRERMPLLRAAIAEAGHGDNAGLLAVVDAIETREPAELQAEYVQEFDLSRRHSLHLSYWTDGDTRRRGEALARFKDAYRAHGAAFDETELPDYLPMVLEFAALVSPADGLELMQSYRASIELLRLALERDRLIWAPAVALVCATLPGPSPATEADAMALAAAAPVPPVEQVGLDPYPTGLLPLRTVEHAEHLEPLEH
jgi:nitrate reductase delta subunit